MRLRPSNGTPPPNSKDLKTWKRSTPSVSAARHFPRLRRFRELRFPRDRRTTLSLLGRGWPKAGRGLPLPSPPPRRGREKVIACISTAVNSFHRSPPGFHPGQRLTFRIFFST